MGFRFRKSVKILPGVRVNISKKGVSSVSVGKRGASINVGKNGTHANVGLNGTGLSYRTKLSSGTSSSDARGGCASFFIKVIVMLILAIVGLFVYAAFIGPKEPATSKPSGRGSSSVEKEVATPISEESTEPEQIERGKTDKLDNLF